MGGMQLRDWLNIHRPRKQGAFAQEIGVSRTYLSLLLSGAKEPGRNVMRRIHEATSGAVTPNDWVLGTADSDHTNGNEDRGALCP
jgi:DNA-binding transcriptional regulator YdaS (Cro superfamily)